MKASCFFNLFRGIIFFLGFLTMPCGVSSVYSDNTHGPDWLRQQRQYRKKTASAMRITPQMAYALFKSGKALLISVDDQEYFQRRHIVGSVNIPPKQLKQVRLKAPKGKMILLYCR